MQILVLGSAALVALMQVQRNNARSTPAWVVAEPDLLTFAPILAPTFSQKR